MPTCTCGHDGLLHILGLGCCAVVEWREGTPEPDPPYVFCSCEEFTPASEPDNSEGREHAETKTSPLTGD